MSLRRRVKKKEGKNGDLHYWPAANILLLLQLFFPLKALKVWNEWSLLPLSGMEREAVTLALRSD